MVSTMAGMTVALALLLVSPTLAMIVAVMAISGFFNGPMDVALFTLRQRRTDPAWMGRAFAVSMSLNFSGYPLGAVIGGILVAYGTTPAILAAVVFGVLGTMFAAILLPRQAAERSRVDAPAAS